MSEIIYRPHDWFDIEKGKPVYAVQAAYNRGYPKEWMHVMKDGELLTFGGAGARGNWLKSRNNLEARKND